MFHTIVIEFPDNRDGAAMEAAVTKAIENATHLYSPVCGSGLKVIEYHHEKMTEDGEEDRVGTIVVGTTTNAVLHVKQGQRARVIQSFWRNGEGHLSLQDMSTGTIFNSPDVLWEEEEA